MPTYTYSCSQCFARHEIVMPISQYVVQRPQPHHCGQPMIRVIDTAPALGLVNERHYDGLRAPDGTDISSRAKHRQYMKEHNLTTVDDFKETWAREARERKERLQGADTARSRDIAQAIEALGGEDVQPRTGG